MARVYKDPITGIGLSVPDELAYIYEEAGYSQEDASGGEEPDRSGELPLEALSFDQLRSYAKSLGINTYQKSAEALRAEVAAAREASDAGGDGSEDGTEEGDGTELGAQDGTDAIAEVSTSQEY